MKLSYDKSWSDDEQVAIAELFDLDETQADRLFEQHKMISVSDTFKQKWERFLSDRDVEAATASAPPVKDVSIAGSHAKLARDMADIIKNDAAINERAKLTIVSGEEVKRGPLALYLLLAAKYNKPGSNMTLAMFPHHEAVGWTQTIKHDDGTEENIPASSNPAKWKVPGRNAKTGNAIQVPYDWYQIFADDTAFGEEIVGAQEACQKAQEAFKEKGNSKGIADYVCASGEVIKFSEMTGHDIEAETKTWTQRRSRLAGQYRAVGKLQRQFDAVKDYENIILTVAKRPDGTLKRVTSPITVVDKNDLGAYKQFTPSQFTQLDFATAKDNGGTYENLMNTVKKGTKTDTATAVLVDAIKSATTADEYVASLVNYLDKQKPSGEFAFNKYLNELDKEKHYTHDDALLSCRDLRDHMASICDKHATRLQELDEMTEAEKERAQG